MKRSWVLALGVMAALAVGLAAKAGSFLVVDAPRPLGIVRRCPGFC